MNSGFLRIVLGVFALVLKIVEGGYVPITTPINSTII